MRTAIDGKPLSDKGKNGESGCDRQRPEVGAPSAACGVESSQPAAFVEVSSPSSVLGERQVSGGRPRKPDSDDAKHQARREYMREYQGRWLALRRAEWLAENGPCQQCGSTRQLQVDHKEPGEKLSHRIWSWSKERLAAELAKCQVLCRKCHERKTSLEFARLTPAQIVTVRSRYRSGSGSYRTLAREFGVSHNTIARIATGDRFSWLTDARVEVPL